MSKALRAPRCLRAVRASSVSRAQSFTCSNKCRLLDRRGNLLNKTTVFLNNSNLKMNWVGGARSRVRQKNEKRLKQVSSAEKQRKDLGVFYQDLVKSPDVDLVLSRI